MNFYASLLETIDTARSERQQIPTGFAVHVNNGLRAAVESLMANYPSVAGAVGATEFRALARAYVLAHPPTDSRLFLYGASFGDWLDAWHDLAAKDRMGTEAHTAADAKILDATRFAADMQAGRVDRLELAPSTRWHQSAGVLMTRPDDTVITTPLTPAGAAFLDACRDGLALPEAVQAALLTDEDTDIQALLTMLFKLGAFREPSHPH